MQKQRFNPNLYQGAQRHAPRTPGRFATLNSVPQRQAPSAQSADNRAPSAKPFGRRRSAVSASVTRSA